MKLSSYIKVLWLFGSLTGRMVYATEEEAYEWDIDEEATFYFDDDWDNLNNVNEDTFSTTAVVGITVTTILVIIVGAVFCLNLVLAKKISL